MGIAGEREALAGSVRMSAVLMKLGEWLLRKIAAAALIALVALAGWGLWLFLRDEMVREEARVGRLARALTEVEGLRAAKVEVEKRLAAARADITAQEERIRQAERVATALRELESWWERWFGDTRQQAANAERRREMERVRTEADGKIADLRRIVAQGAWEREGVERALGRTEREISMLEGARSRVTHYARAAWDAAKWYIAAALAGYFFGPILGALALYHGLAPRLARGRPIRLGPEPAALPEVGESHVSVEETLAPGEVLRVREKFLQASDEGMRRRTRWVLDWKIPLTSLACGLVELIELQPSPERGARRVTLSNSEDPHIELAQMTVPAGASIVLRPRFLAGVAQREGDRLEIRRHWRILRWQSWVTGQFRFFEFVGPCRILLAGSRGVRAERLEGSPDGPAPARRTNQGTTIGFTPNLEYRPVRAETFWSYYRGMNPLFDDVFSGRGLFIVQETVAGGAEGGARRFWAGVWNGALKAFGL